jgi:hypothetical protein
MELNNAIKIIGEIFNASSTPVTQTPADPETSPRFWITKYGSTRFWAVYDQAELVAVTVYKKGATEVYNRLTA